MPRFRFALALAMSGFALAAPLGAVGLPGLGATAAYAQQASVSFNVFFDKLSDGGHWVKHPSHNYVFCPDVDQTWSPYTNGHWVYLADRGWYFNSDEPYAWAVYHYGRWFQDADLGWCWVPGNVWAPAWVSWRHSSDYIGWAPLEPEGDGFAVGDKISVAEPPRQTWVFIPVISFVEPESRSHVVFEHDKPDAYDRSQSAGSVVVRNNIVVNTVISLNLIQDATKKPVPTVKPQTVTDPTQLKGGTAQAGTIAVFDPKLDAPKKTDAPKQAEDTAQAVQQHKDKTQATPGAATPAPASNAPAAPATNAPVPLAPVPGDKTKTPAPDTNSGKPPAGKPAADCATQDMVNGVCPPKDKKGTTPPTSSNASSNAAADQNAPKGKATDNSTPAPTSAPNKSAPASKPTRTQDCPNGKIVNGVCETGGHKGKAPAAASDQSPPSNAGSDQTPPSKPSVPSSVAAPNASSSDNGTAAPKASNGKQKLRCPPGEEEVQGACVPKAGGKPGASNQSQ